MTGGQHAMEDQERPNHGAAAPHRTAAPHAAHDGHLETKQISEEAGADQALI